MATPERSFSPTRAVLAFRRDGAYSLMVYLHAKTVQHSGVLDGRPDFDRVAAAMSEALETLEGMERYHSHPFRRTAPVVSVAWRAGSVRLLDFGGDGPPILTIPSLVNGSEIMDLSPTQSPLRWLANQGFRVFQIDWGLPGAAERRFGLGDYLDQRGSRSISSVIVWVGR